MTAGSRGGPEKEPRREPAGAAGVPDREATPVDQLFEAERSSEIVAASFAHASNPRLREILESLTRHLHAFAKEVDLTTDEWSAGVRFLTETGQTCDDARQEFVLLSDVLGVSMLVETLDNLAPGTVTETTVEGPFHVVASPARTLGADINEGGRPGEPCVVVGRVLNAVGGPVPGATVDVWQADAEGFYDVQRPGVMAVGELRGMFTTDPHGRYWFRTIVPSHYPIPTDGPVGELLRLTGRHQFRPAHIHFEVSAPGLRTATTHIFVNGSPYLGSDAVFGVKRSLIYDFERRDDPVAADRYGIENPFRCVEFDVALGQAER